MPKAKKPVGLHMLHGTYQPCRHGDRASKAINPDQKRTIPEWLPDNVKPIYKKLMETLPPLDAVDETPLAQMAILKRQLQEEPYSMTSSQHGQLRQLAAMIREWVRDYLSITEPVLDEYEQWQQRRARAKEEREAGSQQQKVSQGDQKPTSPSASKYQSIPLPKNLKCLK